MQTHLEKADDYKKMKELHKSLSESVKKTFQTEAFGDGLEECLKKIDQEIGILFERLKIKMTKNIEAKVKAQIQELTKPIIKKLRQDEYQAPQDYFDDLKELKTQFEVLTKDQSFKKKELLLSQDCEGLTRKILESLWMKQRDKGGMAERQMKERTKFLEEQLLAKKEEMAEIRIESSTKLDKYQTELHEKIARSNISEQKLL